MKGQSGHSLHGDQRYRIIAEDEPSSDVEPDDLDINPSARKALNISQYIEAIAQSQFQPGFHGSKDSDSGDVSFVSDEAGNGVAPKQDPGIKAKNTRPPSSKDGAASKSAREGSESDWSDGAPYREYQQQKTLKRQRVAAEARRIRSEKKARADAATSVIGRKPFKKPVSSKEQISGTVSFSDDDGSEHNNTNETHLDDPIPEYIEARRRELHKAGFRFPPAFDQTHFSGSMSEEKPVMPKSIKPQQEKKDIILGKSRGVIPASIAQWLRGYQVDGVRFLHEWFVKQTGALLCDDMGLGKTIQVIAFLTVAFGKTGTKSDAKLMRHMRRSEDWYPRVLIICPTSLMTNWEDELKKWGWWQVDRYHGTPDERKGIINAAEKGMLEILITTYTTYRKNQDDINTIDWDCVIADEVHAIKTKQAATTQAMNKINALCRIGLTGTAIQNKYEELWTLLNWARPGKYRSSQEWKQGIAIPLKLGQAHDATHAQLAERKRIAEKLVTQILPSVFLRRMKSLIAHQLPKKTDRIVFCQLTKTQANAYQTFLDSDKVEYIRTAKTDCDCGSGKKRGWCCYMEVPEGGQWLDHMFPCLVTLQKLACHIALLLPRDTDPKEKQKKDIQNLKLCFPKTWQSLVRDRAKKFQISKTEFCGKWKVLRRLLDFWHASGDKVLIFSHSVRLLKLLKTLFDTDGTDYNFSYLDGSMAPSDRANAVADFNSNPDQFVFLISARAGGVGLNITSANKVVVIDPHWNPAYDLQAQDRAYRIGQTRDVEVFRLVSAGTIEEIIYARQIYKQQQANIGYTASTERRYFKGVMDRSDKSGEIFGLQNIFKFEENGLLLRDIVHKTNIAETRAGVKMVDFAPGSTSDLEDEGEDILSDANLGIVSGNADDDDTSQMKGLADRLARNLKNSNKKTEGHFTDPVNAILARAGVQYTHDNSEVIGRSEVEAELGRQAMELRNDVNFASKAVFQLSQSQSQSQARPQNQPNIAYSEDEDEITLLGSGRVGGKKEFDIQYKYQPSEEVKNRQFCSIAKIMGYEDPVEFAHWVETQTGPADRKAMLEKFYRRRRKELWEELR